MRVAALAVLAALSLAPALAHAQMNHAAGHSEYRKWHNMRDFPCCDNSDCGELADADAREVGDRIDVRVEGQWCEVMPWMRLKTGNAPNWSVNHACVLPAAPNRIDNSPCGRLVCFQPKPGS